MSACSCPACRARAEIHTTRGETPTSAQLCGDVSLHEYEHMARYLNAREDPPLVYLDDRDVYLEVDPTKAAWFDVLVRRVETALWLLDARADLRARGFGANQ